MEEELGKKTTTQLAPYFGVVSLTKEQAGDIANTLWPKAPAVERAKAALICAMYGLNPLMKHLHLVKFKTKEGDVWTPIVGIQATRLIASRKTQYSYLDGPRMMTKVEQERILGEIDDSKYWAITVIQDANGNKAPGYGNWSKDKEHPPYGSDKGNTPQNMAMIRSERNAFDRLLPGEMPQGVEVIDATFIDGEWTSPGGDKRGKVEPPAPSPVKGEELPKPEAIKNLGQFFEACQKHFNLTQAQALKELGLSDKSQIADTREAWATIIHLKTPPPETTNNKVEVAP